MLKVIKPLILGAAVAVFTAACILGTPTPPPPTQAQGETPASGVQNPPVQNTPPAAATTPAATISSTRAPTSTPESFIVQGRTVKQYARPPLITIDLNANYSATFRTNSGSFTVELFASQAPVTVNNFVFLANEGFYNGVIFHRVIPDFMIQSGDPTGTGGAGPGYQFQDEMVPALVFSEPGVLAMANAGPNTNGSQFFITVAPTQHLDGKHSIFGRVVLGQDVVNAISMMRTGGADRPLEPVVIQSIDITVVG